MARRTGPARKRGGPKLREPRGQQDRGAYDHSHTESRNRFEERGNPDHDSGRERHAVRLQPP